jgi:hypothetical protein
MKYHITDTEERRARVDIEECESKKENYGVQSDPSSSGILK